MQFFVDERQDGVCTLCRYSKSAATYGVLIYIGGALYTISVKDVSNVRLPKLGSKGPNPGPGEDFRYSSTFASKLSDIA